MNVGGLFSSNIAENVALKGPINVHKLHFLYFSKHLRIALMTAPTPSIHTHNT